MINTNDATVHCQNCNAILLGNYCHECGQARRSPLRRLPIFINDWVMEALEIDRKVMPSLGKILFKPGRLTLEYWQGRRAAQVHPIRSYLILSLLYFALLATFNTKGFLGGMIQSSEAEFVTVMPKLMIAMVPLFAAILYG